MTCRDEKPVPRAVVLMVVIPDDEADEPLAAYRATVELGPDDVRFLEDLLRRIREAGDGKR